MKARKYDTIEIWTDGSYKSTIDQGGIGAFIKGFSDLYEEVEIGSRFQETTNNQMELLSIYMALDFVKGTNKPIILYSDSQYCVNTFNLWLDKWKEEDKLNKKKNIDLILSIDKLKQDLDIEFRWVKGHADDENNNRADKICTNINTPYDS